MSQPPYSIIMMQQENGVNTNVQDTLGLVINRTSRAIKLEALMFLFLFSVAQTNFGTVVGNPLGYFFSSLL